MDLLAGSVSWRDRLRNILCTVNRATAPALRTVVALLVWGGLKLSGRQWSGWSVWICCLAAILVVDPVAVLSQSLWLSAFAVAALLFWYQWVPMPDWPLSRVGRQFLALAHLQLGITLLLLPVQIAMFHGFSLTSFLANLFAVPLVTFISVPLILAGMIVHLTGLAMVESNLWYLADRSLALLFWGSGACLKGGSILMHVGNGLHLYPDSCSSHIG